MRNKCDNVLSRHFMTNEMMIRYIIIQSNFLSDTMFATLKAKSTKETYVASYLYLTKDMFQRTLW